MELELVIRIKTTTPTPGKTVKRVMREMELMFGDDAELKDFRILKEENNND